MKRIFLFFAALIFMVSCDRTKTPENPGQLTGTFNADNTSTIILNGVSFTGNEFKDASVTTAFNGENQYNVVINNIIPGIDALESTASAVDSKSTPAIEVDFSLTGSATHGNRSFQLNMVLTNSSTIKTLEISEKNNAIVAGEWRPSGLVVDIQSPKLEGLNTQQLADEISKYIFTEENMRDASITLSDNGSISIGGMEQDSLITKLFPTYYTDDEESLIYIYFNNPSAEDLASSLKDNPTALEILNKLGIDDSFVNDPTAFAIPLRYEKSGKVLRVYVDEKILLPKKDLIDLQLNLAKAFLNTLTYDEFCNEYSDVKLILEEFLKTEIDEQTFDSLKQILTLFIDIFLDEQTTFKFGLTFQSVA